MKIELTPDEIELLLSLCRSRHLPYMYDTLIRKLKAVLSEQDVNKKE
jgi:hypothetical protein